MENFKKMDSEINQLKRQDYAKYLPYGLRVQYDEYDVILNLTDPDLIFFIDTKKDEIKPYLRPISQMAQEITHEGKTFVPIIELAKMAGYNEYYNVEYLDKDRIWVELEKDNRTSFMYLDGKFGSAKFALDFIAAKYQLRFFEELWSWHFWLGDQNLFKTGHILEIQN